MIFYSIFCFTAISSKWNNTYILQKYKTKDVFDYIFILLPKEIDCDNVSLIASKGLDLLIVSEI